MTRRRHTPTFEEVVEDPHQNLPLTGDDLEVVQRQFINRWVVVRSMQAAALAELQTLITWFADDGDATCPLLSVDAAAIGVRPAPATSPQSPPDSS